MRIVAITDLHGNTEALRRILTEVQSCDVLLFGGDITHFGSASDAARILDLSARTARRIFAVSGNCDNASVENQLAEQAVNLHGRGEIIDGVGFFGLSGIPVWQPGMFQFPEETLAEHLVAGWAQVADAARHVLLAHVPPHHTTLDRTMLGCHVGSRAVREFLDEHPVKLFLCGHIHEARGYQTMGPTTLVNCGPARRGNYAVISLDDTSVDVQLLP